MDLWFEGSKGHTDWIGCHCIWGLQLLCVVQKSILELCGYKKAQLGTLSWVHPVCSPTREFTLSILLNKICNLSLSKHASIKVMFIS